MSNEKDGPVLLPCPFCGTAVQMLADTHTRVWCPNDQCIIWGGTHGMLVAPYNGETHKFDAIEAWNRRAIVTAAPPHTPAKDGGAVAWIEYAECNGEVRETIVRRKSDLRAGYLNTPLYTSPPPAEPALVERARAEAFYSGKAAAHSQSLSYDSLSVFRDDLGKELKDLHVALRAHQESKG